MSGKVQVKIQSNLIIKIRIRMNGLLRPLQNSQINWLLLLNQQKRILGIMLQPLLSHQSTSGMHKTIPNFRINQHRNRQKNGFLLFKQNRTTLGLQKKSFRHLQLSQISGVLQHCQLFFHKVVISGTKIKVKVITEMILKIENKVEVAEEETGFVVGFQIMSQEIIRKEHKRTVRKM